MTPFGLRVLVESSNLLPLVDVSICLRGGTDLEVPEQAGAARLMARLLRHGTNRYSRRELAAAFESLGGRFTTTIARHVVRIRGTVLSRNIEPFVELLSHMLTEARLSSKDLRREKSLAISELKDNQNLLARHERQLFFGEHRYGLPTTGNVTTTRAVSIEAVRDIHRKSLCRDNLLFSFAGDISDKRALEVIDAHFGTLPKGRLRKPTIKTPKLNKGRLLRVVEKADFSQAPLSITTNGFVQSDPFLTAAIVGNHAFGGLFSSRLTQEVRAKRGLSYSASSTLRALKKSASWTLWTHPSIERVRECAVLNLELLERFCDQGPTEKELRQAKRHLRGSRALDVDTADSRVSLSVDAVLFDKCADWPGGFGGRVGRVNRKSVTQAFSNLDRSRLCICVVGDPKVLTPALSDLVDTVEVVDANDV